MLLAQLGAGDWVGLTALTLTILGGLAHLVRKATQVESKLTSLCETMDSLHEERKEEKQDREGKDKAIYTKLANHEGRIIKLEAYRQ